ncbi:MAG: PDZ domain-containing protein, partial [Steroidobacteraceae bacterium]
LGRTNPSAILIVEVQSGGPADQAGLREGDVLLELDGHALAGLDHLHRLLTAELAEREVPLRVLRRGQIVMTTIRPTTG